MRQQRSHCLKPAYLANIEQDENMNDDFPKFPPSSSSPMPRHSGRKVHNISKTLLWREEEHYSSGYNIRTDIVYHARCAAYRSHAPWTYNVTIAILSF